MKRGLLALPLVVFFGCGRSADSVAPEATAAMRQAGGTAVLGSISDVDSWNEYLSQQTFAANLLRRIYLGLAREQAEATASPDAYAPLLAESWTFSGDGLDLTFRLREARWSDGQPITAEDVRFTWQAQTSADVPWTAASTKEQIRDVEVVDPRTVIFHFKRKYPYQLADAVEGGIVPRHVFGEIPFTQWAGHDWSAARVGSGPFLLENHDPGHEIVLVKNPRYYVRDRPLLERVVVRIVPDAGNLLTQLMSGDIDYMEGLAPRDAHRLAGRADVVAVPFDSPQFEFIGWNGSRPPFGDPLVRRAFTLALDREALVEDLLYAMGRVSRGPVLSFAWGADRTLTPWPFDPGEARRLLAERGFATTAQDGSRSPGRDLEFELLTNAGNRLREEVQLKVQEQLSRIGVRVRVRPLEMKTMRQQVASGDYDAYLGGWTFSGKADLKPIFGSAFGPPEGMNVVFYRSAEADRLLLEIEQGVDAQEVKERLSRLQRRIHEDQPYTFLYESRRVAAHGPRLQGVTIDLPSDSLARLEDFWVRVPG